MLKVLRPEFVDAHGLKCGTTYQYRFTPYGRISRGGASIYFPYDEGNIENDTGLHTAYRQRAEMAVGRRNGDDEALLIGAAAGRRRGRISRAPLCLRAATFPGQFN